MIRFTSYAFDLSLFSAPRAEPFMFPKDRTLPYLLNPDPNDRVYKHKPQSFRAELHRRFTEWLYPLVFALIALAVAGDARSHREARINPLITAVTICAVRPLARLLRRQPEPVRRLVLAVRLCRAARRRGGRDLVHPHQPHDGAAGRAGRTAGLDVAPDRRPDDVPALVAIGPGCLRREGA